jgi:hypothetical protein
MADENLSLNAPSLSELEKLKPFASNRAQLRNIDAVLEYKTHQAAADAIGVARQTVSESLRRLKQTAIKRGWSPEHDMTKAAPEGFGVSGVSTLYGADGEKKIQWVKTKALEEEKIQRIIEAIETVMSDVTSVEEIPAPKVVASSDVLTVYPMGDPHIGMYAWAKETGDDFDLKIAERNLVTAVNRLVESAPASDKALIVNVGDFFHSDNKHGTTTKGTMLDMDSRWSHVLQVGVRAMRACIEATLKKHQHVHVINEIGNHDDHTSQVLTLALAMAYEQNPRVTFDESPSHFHYYRFHDVLIGVTHGDTVKPGDLGGVMAADKAEDWGQTTRRYWYTGHVHNRQVFELPGCEVESFRTLAPKDAWTASMGYRSGRDMYCIVLHKNFGEIERHRKDILMLKE